MDDKALCSLSKTMLSVHVFARNQYRPGSNGKIMGEGRRELEARPASAML